MKCLLILLILISFKNAYAFNSSKCKREIQRGMCVWGSCLVTSTSQFTTSTGECALIGMLDHDKKVYIAQNAELLQIDIARGNGEYLNNYAILAGCDSKKLSPLLQNNYDQIFYSNDLSPEKVYLKIERLIIENNKANELCRPLV